MGRRKEYICCIDLIIKEIIVVNIINQGLLVKEKEF